MFSVIKKLFCKHEWSPFRIKSVYGNLGDKIPKYSEGIRYCKKCNKSYEVSFLY